jgi:hypothetical protein
MKTFSRLLAALFVLALVGGTGSAAAQGMIGTSTCSGGGLSMGAATATFLRLDCTNAPLTGALSSSNGTFGTSGTLTPLVLESTLAATAGVDVGMIFRNTADLAAADTAFAFRDNTATTLMTIAGTGAITAGGPGFYAQYHLSVGGTAYVQFPNVDSTIYMSSETDGAAAVGHIFDTVNTMTTTAKLLSIKNATVEKSYINALGGYVTTTGSVTAVQFAATSSNLSLFTSTTVAGRNLTIGSLADAAGEYGVVVGSRHDSTTAQIDFAVANDVDGTPVYVFGVEGTGRTSVGSGVPTTLSVLSVTGTYTGATFGDSGLYLAATLEPTNEAYGIRIGGLMYLDPATTYNAIGIEVNPTIVADAGETIPFALGVEIPALVKSGTGTITNSIGLYVTESAIGGTLNLAIDAVGTTRTTGLLFGAANSSELTGSGSSSGTLDFGSIAAATCADLTQALAGAVINDTMACSFPSSLEANLDATCFVTATDVVTYRLCNPTAAAIDPANGKTFAARYFH